jgi:hypothetical protein
MKETRSSSCTLTGKFVLLSIQLVPFFSGPVYAIGVIGYRKFVTGDSVDYFLTNKCVGYPAVSDCADADSA